MKQRALKSKEYCQFWSYAKLLKLFSKINDGFKFSLQKWLISHLHFIQYPITNDNIAVKSDDGNLVVKTELRQEFIIQVSVRGIHIDMLKIC